MMNSSETSENDNNNKKNDHQHTYEGALDALLRSPLHQAKTKEELAQAAARRTVTISDMRTYLRRLGLDNDDNELLNRLPSNIIHITGTKGKGSTCCLCESILRQRYGYKTGLFTSPHLVDIRERIRIDGKPISKPVFAKVYWEVRKRLEQSANAANAEAAATTTDAANKVEQEEDTLDDLPILPGYFRMLTLMALFAFAHYEPKLDVIILEVGMGGRYDATNIIDMMIRTEETTTTTRRRNVVCGVTLLDLDHTRVLGDTLEKIAWEKGGIFQCIKGQSTSSSTTTSTENRNNDDNDSTSSFFVIDTNTPGVISVLEKCAKEEGNDRKLNLVGKCTSAVPNDAVIGLPGKHQRINAELALALCQALVKKSSTTTTTTTTTAKKEESDTSHQEALLLRKALENASWPGRCQTVSLPMNQISNATKSTTTINLRLDGSHTPISLRAGYEWFCSVSSSSSSVTTDDDDDLRQQQQQPKRILIFNCSHERNPVELLQILIGNNNDDHDDDSGTTTITFEKVFFCRSDFERPSAVTKKDAKTLLKDANIQPRNEFLPEDNNTTTTTTTGVVTTWQMTLESIWKHLERESSASSPAAAASSSSSQTPVVASETMVNLTVGEALEQLVSKPENEDGAPNPRRMEVFIVGSLYIVGSALNSIGWSEQEATGDLRL